MMAYYAWKAKYDALSARERKIYDLARQAVNAMGFALQNMHRDGIVEKYERKSEAAMDELFEVLTATITEVPCDPSKK